MKIGISAFGKKLSDSFSNGGDMSAEESLEEARYYGGDLADIESPGQTDEDDPDEIFRKTMEKILGQKESVEFLNAVYQEDEAAYHEKTAGDIADWNFERILGLMRLITSNGNKPLQQRLPPLLKALRVLRDDCSFDLKTETQRKYWDAASRLAERGFRYVIFGHTHHAKDIDLGNGCCYFNTGTWADIIQFPDDIIVEHEKKTLNNLRDFVNCLISSNFDEWIVFEPTYVKLEINSEEQITKAELQKFKKGEPI